MTRLGNDQKGINLLIMSFGFDNNLVFLPGFFRTNLMEYMTSLGNGQEGNCLHMHRVSG